MGSGRRSWHPCPDRVPASDTPGVGAARPTNHSLIGDHDVSDLLERGLRDLRPRSGRTHLVDEARSPRAPRDRAACGQPGSALLLGLLPHGPMGRTAVRGPHLVGRNESADPDEFREARHPRRRADEPMGRDRSHSDLDRARSRDTDRPLALRGRLRERASIGPGYLELEASVEAREPMPAAVGWHPWFAATGEDDVRIRLDAGHVLVLDPELIPTGSSEPVTARTDLRRWTEARDRALDDVYVDVVEPAQVRWPDLALEDLERAPVASLRDPLSSRRRVRGAAHRRAGRDPPPASGHRDRPGRTRRRSVAGADDALDLDDALRGSSAGSSCPIRLGHGWPDRGRRGS